MPNKAAAVADESIEAPERRVTFLEWSRRGACRRPPVLGLGQLLQNLPPETGGIALGTASTGNTLLPPGNSPPRTSSNWKKVSVGSVREFRELIWGRGRGPRYVRRAGR